MAGLELMTLQVMPYVLTPMPLECPEENHSEEKHCKLERVSISVSITPFAFCGVTTAAMPQYFLQNICWT